MAVMLCLRCDPTCGAYKAGSDAGESKTWVYVALCADTSHVKGRAFGSPLARGLYPRASTAEVDPQAKSGAPDDPVDSIVKDDLVVADVADAVAGTCVSDEGLRALNEYYNEGLRDPAKKIIVVPCRLRRSVDTCQGVVLADVGLTELY
jgi:hypothetical protein